jgi:hypothetical protein
MVLVMGFKQGHEKSSVGNHVHLREYPLREERSGGPSFRIPANFLQA